MKGRSFAVEKVTQCNYSIFCINASIIYYLILFCFTSFLIYFSNYKTQVSYIQYGNVYDAILKSKNEFFLTVIILFKIINTDLFNFLGKVFTGFIITWNIRIWSRVYCIQSMFMLRLKF